VVLSATMRVVSLMREKVNICEIIVARGRLECGLLWWEHFEFCR
jgi:hypothetical protein